MTNASDRPSLPYDRANVVNVFSAADFGVASMAPDGNIRVQLVDGVLYRCSGVIQLPLLEMPKASAPGTFTVVAFEGPATFLVNGSTTSHIWGRDISALSFSRISFIDTSNGGAGRGTVLMDIVGGNGASSLLSLAQVSFVRFKRLANTVDLAITMGASQDIESEQGFVARQNAGPVAAHFLSLSPISGLASAPDNRAAAFSFLGNTGSATVIGNEINLGKPANSFLFIDGATPVGSYSIVAHNWPGIAAGQFFRPDEIESITAQSDASISVLSFADSAAAPGVDTTVNFAGIVDLTRGQVIVIAGGTYAGTHTIVRVADDQTSFDISVVFAGASAGTLALTEHTVADCRFVRDETVTISATTNYNGTHQIVRRTDTSFVLPQVFAGNDATGTATSQGRDQTSPGVGGSANGALPDSAAVGEVSWNGNAATTTVADGSYSVLALTNVTLSNEERFVLKDAATGEMTYVGKRPFKGTYTVDLQAFKPGASLATYRLAISINQAVPVFASAPYTTLDLRDTTEFVGRIDIVNLQPEDDIRVMIAGDGFTTAPTIVEGQLVIQG
jgi:hypothetical protein